MDVFPTPLFRLSQGHLNLLQTCPPQFQKIYLEQLTSLPELERLEAQKWGTQFHWLMQQRELGLSIEDLVQEDSELYRSIQTLLEVAPEIKDKKQGQIREAEHCRTFYYDDCLFTVIYDLMVLEPGRAMIFDWKTYLKPAKSEKIKNNWQTKLYMYALVETSDYIPEEISMTYWFVQLPDIPQKITFNYDSQQHRQNKEELDRLLKEFKKWLKNYQDKCENFPHISDCQVACPYYKYTDKSKDIYFVESESIQLESIEEINPFIEDFGQKKEDYITIPPSPKNPA